MPVWQKLNILKRKALRVEMKKILSWLTTSSLISRRGLYRGSTAILAVLLICASATTHAQNVTATLSGTVMDPTGAVIPGAKVTLVNEATNDTRVSTSTATGFFAFPAAQPGSYTLRLSATGFSKKNVSGIVLHAGDVRTVPDLALAIGTEQQTVSVEASSQIILTSNGERSSILSYQDIQNLALEGRDTTELLKVLPGVTTVSGGLTQSGSEFTDINVGASQSAIGGGLQVNGVPYKGGTALLSDGVSILDPGDDAGSLATISPEMTQEVSVQSSNFGAEAQFGPVVVSAISKSGTNQYHGEAYFDARNDVLNANDWQSNHQGIDKAGAFYYYPGGNIGGPIPLTQKKAFFWFGYERFLQNQGNANKLTSYIPSPEMMAGDFTSDNPDNVALCPNGFSSGAQGNWCNDLTNTILPDGTTVTNGHIPSQFIDPGAAALASFWPKANANPATTPGGYNYYQPIINTNNGWIYRARVDYNLSDQTKFYISYQQGYSGQLAQGNGAHIYWTPGNSIPFPGGGLHGLTYSKALAGHFVHIFNATTTNEFIAAWGYGNFPYAPPNTSAAYKSTLGYPSSYGTVFGGGSKLIPSYSSAGTNTFPDFSQSDIFEPNGSYIVRKEVPSFTDTFTKVWGSHTVKFGAFTQNVSNLQGNDGTNLNGIVNSFGGQSTNAITKRLTGSQNNPVANFVMGSLTSYAESNSAPVSDMAYQDTSFFVDDAFKATSRLSLQLGVRFDHVGHWYDRQGTGMAVFFPDRVAPDYNSGKIDPGFYWHGIDPGIPLSGEPNRLAFVSPRFGVSYDLLGSGKTVLRGGWGAYRFSDQYNDYAAPLTTAQAVQNYGLPGQTSVLLSQIGQLKTAPCTKPPCGISGSQTGLDPSDYGIPLTYAYNFTVDQQLPGNMLLEVAYVGNSSSELNDNGEVISGSSFTAFADQNKTPIGALFGADPTTGLTASNPENVGTTCTGASCNSLAHYRPFGYAYGTNSVYMDKNIGYTNYNGLQVSFTKQTGRLNFNLNGTWSKTLGTGLQANPFVLRANYGVEAIDRPFVFNASYLYKVGRAYTGNKFIGGAVNGWTISGISTWQAGGTLISGLGNGVPNFGLTESYVNIPASAAAAGVGNGIGDPTYFGTDAPIAIQPVLTCNPNAGLAHYQRIQLKCFAAPAVGTNGGQNYPYMSMAAYIDNDLALYKTFPMKREQSVEFRISAFNWLNHPLPEYSSLNQLTLRYLVDYPTKNITLNSGTGGTSPTFGFLDSKDGSPYQRTLELDVKYHF
jgi:Carboxypeptidase regulatory-like domain